MSLTQGGGTGLAPFPRLGMAFAFADGPPFCPLGVAFAFAGSRTPLDAPFGAPLCDFPRGVPFGVAAGEVLGAALG